MTLSLRSLNILQWWRCTLWSLSLGLPQAMALSGPQSCLNDCYMYIRQNAKSTAIAETLVLIIKAVRDRGDSGHCSRCIVLYITTRLQCFSPYDLACAAACIGSWEYHHHHHHHLFAKNQIQQRSTWGAIKAGATRLKNSTNSRP